MVWWLFGDGLGGLRRLEGPVVLTVAPNQSLSLVPASK